MTLAQLNHGESAESSDALGGSLELRITSKKRSMPETTSMTTAQRLCCLESKFEACKNKGRRMAVMDGFSPKLLHGPHIKFPLTPEKFVALTVAEVDALKYLHPHPRDLRVQFFQQEHTYFIDDQKTQGSVTSMIHTFGQPFDADAVIAAMCAGNRWPRAGYLQEDFTFGSIHKLQLLAPELLHLLAGRPRDDARVCEVVQSLRLHFDIEIDINTLTLSAQTIKDVWKARGAEAAHYGAYMHYIFEAFLNGRSVPGSPELRMMRKFLASMPTTCVAWRTEWVILGEEEDLAGSIDFVAKDSDGTFLLVDWKRTSGLGADTLARRTRKMLPPLQDLQDTKAVHYDLQLNVATLRWCALCQDWRK